MRLKIINIIATLGTFSSLAYYVVCIFSASKFLREQHSEKPSLTNPPISILKPLKGIDPGMYESLRSHCLQDYPEYEIVFGVSEASDPSVEYVERLKREFPDHHIRLVVCDKNLGTNTKVSNLVQMLPHSRYENLLVNDSDIRVDSSYLAEVAPILSDPKIGLVTCLYRGIAAKTPGSRLESLGISTDFIPGVLAARLVEGGVHFGLGSTLAFRRQDLQAIGGFEALADYLADDYEIGRRIASLGLEIKLAASVVETFLPSYSLREFFNHQLRWARTVRESRPAGYVGLLVTFGFVWASLAVIFAKGASWAWILFVLTCFIRVAAAFLVGTKVLRDLQVLRWLPIIFVRDVIAVIVWIGSFAGNTIHWRGERFRLKDGKLERAA
ncbi:MAG: bacteriohopanetetrol glucosamine biosynthesis glycosyltransferase HpnI [Acidobacteriota bacterium]|nr:bacteriohopanetetrol glucosamine biosynthesis glycosyltransferase HpnI [Acidobacteriota bacterium]